MIIFLEDSNHMCVYKSEEICPTPCFVLNQKLIEFKGTFLRLVRQINLKSLRLFSIFFNSNYVVLTSECFGLQARGKFIFLKTILLRAPEYTKNSGHFLEGYFTPAHICLSLSKVFVESEPLTEQKTVLSTV